MSNKELQQLTADYWDQRWQDKATGWDIGYAAPALIQYMEQYPNKDATILIPGCGSAYEAQELVKMGFTNITLLEYAPAAANVLKQKFSKAPEVSVVCEDFFSHSGKYDLVLEQTFFCAINPEKREEYANHMHALLKPKGKIVGVLFNKLFENEGPPFGGTHEEYLKLFAPQFEIKCMSTCYNSIAQRSGTELFIQLIKK